MFDAPAFLRDQFREPAGVVSLVSAYGFQPPSEEAVRKWFTRGSVPAVWLAVTLALLELENGAPVSITAYIKGWSR